MADFDAVTRFPRELGHQARGHFCGCNLSLGSNVDTFGSSRERFVIDLCVFAQPGVPFAPQKIPSHPSRLSPNTPFSVMILGGWNN